MKKLSIGGPVNGVVGQIIFCNGNHTSTRFTDKQKALDYVNELWDEEDQSRLLNIEMIIVQQRGYEPEMIHRGAGSNSSFIRKFENLMENLPCPGCDYVTCDCGLGLSLPNTSDQRAASAPTESRC